jgi:hypothetical protein
MRSKRGAFGEAYRVLGTRDDVARCQLCGRTGLTVATVLEVYDEDGQPVGNKYACKECTARVAARAPE